MLFNTISYIVFLSIMVAGVWLLPKNIRTWFILAGSLLFYALWRIEFVFLISFSAFVDYFFALKIYSETRPRWRKVWLLCSLSTNLGLLLYFKYTYFLLDNLSMLGEILGQHWVVNAGRIILPLGISFYTFLSVSYTLDVYRRLFVPIKNFQIYLTYVMFWPHMIAGPILRAHELIPQIAEPRRFNLQMLTDGIRKILFGLFMKVALADQIAPFVDEAFLASPTHLSAIDVWTMAFGFGFQIYFDFAGYSMIAIGSAQMLGVVFPDNFRWPYLARSPREFWQRWHITLSSWIRDYLYLPLCGVPFQDRSAGGLEVNVAKPSSLRLSLALFLTWFLMGLWHGAAWRFAFWGVWHAVFIWLYRVATPGIQRLPNFVRNFGGWGITLAISMLGWIPFRAQSLHKTILLLGKVIDLRNYHWLTFRENFYLIVAVLFVSMLVVHGIVRASKSIRWRWVHLSADVASLTVVIFVVYILLRPTDQFIYFQF